MSEFKVNVGVNLNDKELDSLDRRLEKLKTTPIPIQIKIDTDGIKNLESQVSRQVRKMTGNNSVGNIKIGADVDSRSFAQAGNAAKKELDKSFSDYSGYKPSVTRTKKDAEYFVRQVKAKQQEVNKLLNSDSAGSAALEEATEQLKFYRKELSTTMQVLDSAGDKADEKLDNKLKKRIDRTLQESRDAINLSNKKLDDLSVDKAISKKNAQVEAEFKKLKSSMKEMYSLQEKLEKIDANKNPNKYKEYQDQLDSLTKANDEAFLKSYRDFDDDMFEELAANRADAINKINATKADVKDSGLAESIKKEITEAQNALNEFEAVAKKKASIEKKLRHNPDSDVNKKELESVSKQYEESETVLLDKIESLSNVDYTKANGMLENMVNTLDRLGYEADEDREKLAALSQSMAENEVAKAKSKIQNFSDVKLADESGKFSNRFNNIENQSEELIELANSYDKAKESYIGYKDSFVKAMDGNDLDAQVKAARELISSFEDLKRVGGDYNSGLNNAERIQKTDKSFRKTHQQIRELDNAKKEFSDKIDLWLKDNSAAASEFGDRLGSIKNRIDSCGDTTALKNLKAEFSSVVTEAKMSGKAMMSFGDKLKEQARQYASYVGIAGVTMAGAAAFRQMAQNVLEVDTAMTGLYRVTDLTAEQYDELYSDMIASSKEYGRTLTDTINATSDWVKAGFNEKDALGLAGITEMYQNVSDLDYAEATENLLTSYKGFEANFKEDFGGDTVGAVEHIVDVLNKLDNEFSVTSAGLGEGLARSASALEIAGNTFEESAA